MATPTSSALYLLIHPIRQDPNTRLGRAHTFLPSTVLSVASRPRLGGYSQARTLQLVWASWRETQLGRNQLDRYSWTGAGTAGQGPAIRTRQVLDRQGFPMCISICSFPSRIDSNKQCFHNQYMHTCLLRATPEYLINANTEKLRESGTFRLLPQRTRTERCAGGTESRDSSEAESGLDRRVEGA